MENDSVITLQDMKQAIDTLSIVEKAELRRYLDAQQPTPDHDLMKRVQALLAVAPPPIIHEGSMDIDTLFEGLRAMTDGLSQAEVEELASAMNERLPSRNMAIE